MPDLDIEQLDPGTPEVADIVAVSDAFYRDLYPAESNHLESIEALQQPGVVLAGCRDGAEVVACGAFKIMRDEGIYGEIKRVYVREGYRGEGLSVRIMRYLEDEMRCRKVEWMRLETGIHQPEAIALYRKLGYRERGPFGAYREDPLSVFMEKSANEQDQPDGAGT